MNEDHVPALSRLALLQHPAMYGYPFLSSTNLGLPKVTSVDSNVWETRSV